MSLPDRLKETVEEMLENVSINDLKKAQKELQSQYKNNRFSSVFQDPLKRLCYLGARFPATYAAVRSVFEKIKDPSSYKTLLDLGAGPATATLAAWEVFPSLLETTLIEKDHNAASLGTKLLELYREGVWVYEDLEKIRTLKAADLAVFSFSLGEIKNRVPILRAVWESGTKTIVIVEPGSPQGYRTILEARSLFLEWGGHIIAPCPHEKTCPLSKGSDWCHFAVRLERTRFHRLLKEGTLNYEDEKFSYLIIGKEKEEKTEGRIIRRPEYSPGHVRLSLCTQDGEAQTITISKKKEKDVYRLAREKEWGDLF